MNIDLSPRKKLLGVNRRLDISARTIHFAKIVACNYTLDACDHTSCAYMTRVKSHTCVDSLRFLASKKNYVRNASV